MPRKDIAPLTAVSTNGAPASRRLLGRPRAGEPARRTRLAVAFAHRDLHLDLDGPHGRLWSGRWTLEVCLDGRRLEPTSDWEETCWYSDREADYLELEIRLGRQMRVQRQVMLARRDRFVFLADVLLGTRPGRLEYRGCVPLGPDVALAAARRTQEAFLVADRRRRGLVLPLALPEWRQGSVPNGLARTEQGLELSQSVEGRRFWAPLFIDLDPRRLTRPVTWRHLTVAQSMAVQPADVALGYRVQVGGRQWLIYRSLAKRANRTLLGHNLSTEMLIARFDKKGEVHSLVEVE